MGGLPSICRILIESNPMGAGGAGGEGTCTGIENGKMEGGGGVWRSKFYGKRLDQVEYSHGFRRDKKLTTLAAIGAIA